MDDALDEFGAGVPLEGMPPRFTIEHGVIHDRKTGKHVRTCDCVKGDGGILDAVRLLNALAIPTFSQGFAAAVEAAGNPENILTVAKAIYELEPFYMPSGEVRDGVQLARKWDWESIPSSRQINLQRKAKAAIEALIRALTPTHTEADG